MGCCCSKSKRPDEIKKIPALALEDTGIPKIDDGWAKIGKMHRTLESDSNDLYEVVETLIEKSGTDEIPQEDITASLRSQMATWKSILDPKQLQAIPNLLLDIPSLQNLDPTISAVLDLTKVFPKLEDPSFETMQKVISTHEPGSSKFRSVQVGSSCPDVIPRCGFSASDEGVDRWKGPRH